MPGQAWQRNPLASAVTRVIACATIAGGLVGYLIGRIIVQGD